MKRKISLATLLVLGALPFGAIAADAADQPKPMDHPAIRSESAPTPPTSPAAKEEPAPLFKQLDANGDNYVTKDEAKRSADVTARFSEVDKDRDGKISSVEFKEGMHAKL